MPFRKIRFLVGTPPYNQGEAASVTEEDALNYVNQRRAVDEGPAAIPDQPRHTLAADLNLTAKQAEGLSDAELRARWGEEKAVEKGYAKPPKDKMVSGAATK